MVRLFVINYRDEAEGRGVVYPNMRGKFWYGSDFRLVMVACLFDVTKTQKILRLILAKKDG